MHDLSLAILLTTMSTRAEKIDEKLNELGQSTVIGEALLEYFRNDNCIYLTSSMFKYLRTVMEGLLEPLGRKEVNPYVLISLCSILKLIRINLRCLSVCKIGLNDIVSPDECAAFEQLEGKISVEQLCDAIEASYPNLEERPDEESKKAVIKQLDNRLNCSELVIFIKKNAAELDDTIVKTLYSSNPGSRMEDLAESLVKAQAGDKHAAEHCCLLFNALTNDKSMQEILRGSKEHFEHCKVVIRVCFELS